VGRGEGLEECYSTERIGKMAGGLCGGEGGRSVGNKETGSFEQRFVGSGSMASFVSLARNIRRISSMGGTTMVPRYAPSISAKRGSRASATAKN
jgi:hypothetical protein